MRAEQWAVCVCVLNWQTESEYSMLLAVPCARDPVEVMTQGHNLRTGFINYLQQKHAAGIVNIQEPGSNQVTTTNQCLLTEE